MSAGAGPAVDVSAVVVAFRSRAHLPACLEALSAAAEGFRLEVVVVDNASPDDTVAWLTAHHPAVRVLRNQENVGFAAAANRGAREAQGRCVLFLNPDARPEPGSLAQLVAEIDADVRVGAVTPLLVRPDGTPLPSVWPAPDWTWAVRLQTHEPDAGGAARDVACASGACLLVRRTCFVELGGFDESFFMYHEDFDFCLRARAGGWRVRIARGARAVHDVGGSAFQDRAAFWRHFHASRAHLLAKHRPGWRGRLLAAACRASAACRERLGLAERTER